MKNSPAKTSSILIAACLALAACATVPAGEEGGGETATALSAEQRAEDVAAIDEIASILLASSDAYTQIAETEVVGRIPQPDQFTLLYESLAEERAARLQQLRDYAVYLGAEDGETGTGEAQEFEAVARLDDAMTAGPVFVLAQTLDGETYLVETLQAYLADEAISVETKTVIQEMLPSLRADRERVALIVNALPAELLEEDLDTALEEAEAENEEAGEASDIDADGEEEAAEDDDADESEAAASVETGTAQS